MRLKRLLEERVGIGVRTDRRKPVVAVPVANSEEIIRCVAEVMRRDLARFILVGDAEAIRACAASTKVSVDAASFVTAKDDIEACRRSAHLAANGDADILMKGLVQTADFMRPILDHENGLLATGQLLSHVALLDVPSYHKLMLLTDAAINVAPSLEQKISMMKNAVDVARSIGIQRPKIACVAPAEKTNPRVPSTIDAAEIRARFAAGELRDILGTVEIDGPFGLDVAISREAAEIKGIGGAVAGDADILLMPNLESGNALYKSLTYFGGAHVAGVVSGAIVPVILTSRADSEQSKLCSVLLALAGIRQPFQCAPPGAIAGQAPPKPSKGHDGAPAPLT